MKRLARVPFLLFGLVVATGACSTGAGSPTGPATSTGGTTGAAGTSAQAGTGGGAAGVAGVAGSGMATGTAGTGTTAAAGTGAAAPDAGVDATDGAAGPDQARPSAGCNKAPAIAKGQFVTSMVGGRNVWVRLPPGYDQSRAYPVIFVWKGCSAAGRTTYGMETAAGNDAIIAQVDFAPGADCYDTADGAKFVDLPVFDALLGQLKSDYCVDQAHLFSAGFSSGAWMTFLLGCQRGDVLRGIGTVAGGFKPSFLFGAPQCKGNGLSAFMVSDLDDHENPFFDEDHDGDSVEIGVNHWLAANGCTEKVWTMQAGQASEPDPTLCRSYAGCGRLPVRLCLTKGVGHAPQEKLSMPGFWQLFQQSFAR